MRNYGINKWMQNLDLFRLQHIIGNLQIIFAAALFIGFRKLKATEAAAGWNFKSRKLILDNEIWSVSSLSRMRTVQWNTNQVKHVNWIKTLSLIYRVDRRGTIALILYGRLIFKNFFKKKLSQRSVFAGCFFSKSPCLFNLLVQTFLKHPNYPQFGIFCFFSLSFD